MGKRLSITKDTSVWAKAAQALIALVEVVDDTPEKLPEKPPDTVSKPAPEVTT